MTVLSRNRWLSVSTGVVALGVYLAYAYYYLPQVNDDAFITFRYARNLALGQGPYYNPGEHVEGYTNFLLVPLIAAVIRAGGENVVLPVAKLIGVLGGCLAIVATWGLGARWLRKIEPVAEHADLLAWLGAALVATNCAFAFNSTTGLETTLFAGWIVLGLWLGQLAADEQRWRGAGVAFALATLTRPEGLLVFAAALLGRLLAAEWRAPVARRHLIIDAGIVAGTVALHLCFRMIAYDGEIVPNTYFAKLGGLREITSARYVLDCARLHYAGIVWILALVPVWVARGGLWRSTLPATLVLASGVAAVFAAGPDWMIAYRQLVPFMPVWAGLALCAAGLLARRAGQRKAMAAAVAGGVLVLGLLWWQEPSRVYYYRYCVGRARGYAEGHVALADWLNQRAQPGQTVALMDIGIVGYQCPGLRILDITGLTDRHIAKSPGKFLAKQFEAAYVYDQAPEYLVIVLTAPVGRDGSYDPDEFDTWTPIEARLLDHPDMRRYYFRQCPVAEQPEEAERLAARYGAARVFRHWSPDGAYFLFAYERHAPISQPTATAATQPS
ncbi:MAG: hypothetical protein KKB50_13260 [Planctomycetes bacterium]|nr:hypothetical protein [Planctomycetota bacterium]